MAGLDHHPVVTQLTEHVTAHVAAWFGAEAALSGPPSVAERTWSYMIRYEVLLRGGTGTAVIAKIPREPGIGTLEEAVSAQRWFEATRLEHETLKAVASAFSQAAEDGFCWIRPLAYFSPCNALVMEELPSQTLKEVLLQGRVVLGSGYVRARSQTVLHRAGRWLRIFHDQVGDRRDEPFAVADTQREVERELHRLGLAMAGSTDLEPLRQAFLRSLRALEGTQVPVAARHGDYNCVNVLVRADGSVCALDMNEDLRGSVYDDLATLMTDLLTRKALLLVYWPLARGRRLRQSCEAVLRGYVADGPFDGRALDLACALAVVRKWRLDEEEQAAGSGGRLARALRPGFRRYFGRLAQSYLR